MLPRIIFFFLQIFQKCICLQDDPLSKPNGYLKYDMKKGASLNPDYESVGYWNGSVYGWTYDNSGLPSYQKLFLFEGTKAFFINNKNIY